MINRTLQYIFKILLPFTKQYNLNAKRAKETVTTDDVRGLWRSPREHRPELGLKREKGHELNREDCAVKCPKDGR